MNIDAVKMFEMFEEGLKRLQRALCKLANEFKKIAEKYKKVNIKIEERKKIRSTYMPYKVSLYKEPNLIRRKDYKCRR